MNKPNPAPEPTMEEILASIRRIISDGDDGSSASDTGAANAKATAAKKSAEPEADIFDLTEDMVEEEVEIAEPPKAKAKARKPEPEVMDPDDIDKLMASEEMDSDDIDKLMAAEAVEETFEADEEDEVVGPESIDITFSEPESEPEPQPEPVAIKRAEPAADVPPGLLSPQSDAAVASAFGRLANTILSRDARTLEDLVGDMLRPMLKEWLDDNLPILVEKLVREEIERVSRGRR